MPDVGNLDGVFRRTSKSAVAERAESEGTATVTQSGKGKATPKRKEAEARRRTSVIAQAGGGRGRSRETREQYAMRREAMKRGDESALLPRDRGPARRFVRDYVDARRSVANYFMPVGLPIILLTYTGIPILALLGMFTLWVFVVGIIVDSVVMTRRIRAEVSARFPKEPTKGLGLYAITRAMQLRRMRIPQPRVSKGAKV